MKTLKIHRKSPLSQALPSRAQSLQQFCGKLINLLEAQMGEKDPMVTLLIEKDIYAQSY